MAPPIFLEKYVLQRNENGGALKSTKDGGVQCWMEKN
jgi:hypothetical protein